MIGYEDDHHKKQRLASLQAQNQTALIDYFEDKLNDAHSHIYKMEERILRLELLVSDKKVI